MIDRTFVNGGRRGEGLARFALSRPAVHWFHAPSLTLAEVVSDQGDNCVQCFALVGAVGLEHDPAAFARSEHHHPHDALGVYLAPITGERDLALIMAPHPGELGRRPRGE